MQATFLTSVIFQIWGYITAAFSLLWRLFFSQKQSEESTTTTTKVNFHQRIGRQMLSPLGSDSLPYWKKKKTRYYSVFHDSGRDGQFCTHRAQIAAIFRKRLRIDVTAKRFKGMTRSQYDSYIDLFTKMNIA